MKIREILSGTALGLINFIYFIFLLLTPLYLFYKNTIPMATPTSFILIYFIAALSLFLIYGILYTKKNIEELNHRTSKKTKNNFIILIEFVLYSLLIMFLSTLFLQIYFKRSNLVSLLLTLLIFSIISSLAIKKIITFFSHIISLQFFIQFYKKYGIRLTGYYKIFTYEEFIDKIQETFNHAKRFNTNMGLIFIYFYDLEKVFSDSEEKFIHKQIHFLFI